MAQISQDEFLESMIDKGIVEVNACELRKLLQENIQNKRIIKDQELFIKDLKCKCNFWREQVVMNPKNYQIQIKLNG